MIWRDADGQLVAFNMVHRSGTEGWMGPLAVRPDRAGGGAGPQMVRTGIEWLRRRRAPRPSVSRRCPARWTTSASTAGSGWCRGTSRSRWCGTCPAAGRRPRAALQARLARGGSRGMSRGSPSALLPGVDFTRELALTRELGIGDTTFVREAGELVGFALWHSTPLAAGRPQGRAARAQAGGPRSDRVRPPDRRAADDRGGRAGGASRSGARPIRLGLPALVAGYRVHWTDLRMTLEGYPRRDPVRGVVMSNWEI